MKKFLLTIFTLCFVFFGLCLTDFTVNRNIEANALESSVDDFSDAYSQNGKRINNSEILSNMTMFPKHSGNNECGMVAMGVLLQFYNEIETRNQGLYIPEELYYDSSYPGDQQEKANALRDDLISRTPKFGEGLFKNMTLPSDQETGLKSYFQEYCAELNVEVHSSGNNGDVEDVKSLIDEDKPTLFTAVWYDYYNTEGEKLYEATAPNPHTMVAYGYRYYAGQLQFLCHMGWNNGTSHSTEIWVSAASVWYGSIFQYGYCYIDNVPLDKFIVAINEDENSAQIVGLDYQYTGKLVVPTKIKSAVVTEIGPRAFFYQMELTRVVLPDTVTSIGEEAFSGCFELKYIELSDSLKYIGESAFALSGLKSIHIPDRVEEIDHSAFSGCVDITRIYFSSDSQLKVIGDRVFYVCENLQSFQLPAKVKSIGSEAFAGCIGISVFTIPKTIEDIGASAFKDWLYDQIIYVQDRISPPENKWKNWNKDCGAKIIWLDSSYTPGLNFSEIEGENRQVIGYLVSAGTSTADTVVIPNIYGDCRLLQ